MHRRQVVVVDLKLKNHLKLRWSSRYPSWQGKQQALAVHSIFFHVMLKRSSILAALQYKSKVTKFMRYYVSTNTSTLTVAISLIIVTGRFTMVCVPLNLVFISDIAGSGAGAINRHIV